MTVTVTTFSALSLSKLAMVGWQCAGFTSALPMLVGNGWLAMVGWQCADFKKKADDSDKESLQWSSSEAE